MNTRTTKNPCEQHVNVKTGREFCPVCLYDANFRLRVALVALVDLHHRTVTMSKKHDPGNRDWNECDCRTCRAVQEALAQ